MSDQASPSITPERIMQFSGGFGPPLVIETALRLDIFDILDDAPKDIRQLVSDTNTSARGLSALLNALVGLGLLTKNIAEQYELTPESSAFLVTGKPTFHGAFFLLTSEAMLPHWGRLTEIVKTGRPTHRVNIEADWTEFFLRFVENIFPIHLPAARCLAETLDITSMAAPVTVLDLAAGSGVWSIALAQQSPHVSVTAVDWPAVIQITRKVSAREGVASRYRYIGADLLEADFGDGYIIATLGHILHSEGEVRSRALLRKAFDALAPGGRVAIAEILVDADRRGPPPALMFAINMLVHTEHGGTFSLDEISTWLRDAGFDGIRTIDAPGLAPRLIVATKPQ